MSPTIIPQERLVQGLIILVFCLVAFVIQTEVTQYLQKTMNFKSPYFILWFSHSFYMIVWPMDMVFRKYYNIDFSESYERIQEEVESLEREQLSSSLPHHGNLFYFGRIVLSIATVLTAGAYLWYVAVGLTSMSSLTSIYNTSCFFAYIFSVYGGLEHFSFTKAGAVILSILGVVIITLFDTGVADTRRSTFIGNSVAIFSAILIGLFEVIYKKYAVSQTKPTALMSSFVTSYVGLVTFAILWLPLPILHITGIEPFSLPGRTSMTLLITNALMGVLYNAGLMMLISITSPVFASVGVMTSIPLISFVDSLLLQQSIPLSVWLGGAIITIGFLVLTRATLAEQLSGDEPFKQSDDDVPSLASPRVDYSGRVRHMPVPTEDTHITQDNESEV